MLDTSKLKVGSVVRMEGRIHRISEGSDCPFYVDFKGNEDNVFTDEEMQHAELVSAPEVSFSREEIEAIKEAAMRERIANINNTPCLPLEAWLEAHEDNSSKQ